MHILCMPEFVLVFSTLVDTFWNPFPNKSRSIILIASLICWGMHLVSLFIDFRFISIFRIYYIFLVSIYHFQNTLKYVLCFLCVKRKRNEPSKFHIQFSLLSTLTFLCLFDYSRFSFRYQTCSSYTFSVPTK